SLYYATHTMPVVTLDYNIHTKSQVLNAISKKDKSHSYITKALESDNAIQLHSYARQLQFQGQKDQALELFRTNVKKFPNEWITHSDAARLACAKGDFDNAVKEMKVAATEAPDIYKSALSSPVRRSGATEQI